MLRIRLLYLNQIIACVEKCIFIYDENVILNVLKDKDVAKVVLDNPVDI